MDSLPDITNAQLHAARARFGNGERLPSALAPDILPEPVARSWARSRDAGLLPWEMPEYEPVGRTPESPEDRHLYGCVADEIEPLWDAFGGNDWTICCVNIQGVVVHARRSPACDDDVILPISAGRHLLESHIGTTAPGCVLHDGIDVTVAGGQHYLDRFEHVSCVAVPLFGLYGQVIGALDLTGRGRRDLASVREHFRLAALAAEQRLFATLRGCHLLRVQHDARWLATPLAGILAVEEDGHLRAASRIARHMLSLPHGTPLPQLTFGDCFDNAWPTVLGRLPHSPQRMARTDGSHLWMHYARAPLNRSTARRADTVPRSDFDTGSPGNNRTSAGALADSSLEDLALAAVRQAMIDNSGNIAAVARQLRISRTTVYARLRQLRETGMLASTMTTSNSEGPC